MPSNRMGVSESGSVNGTRYASGRLKGCSEKGSLSVLEERLGESEHQGLPAGSLAFETRLETYPYSFEAVRAGRRGIVAVP